jgi:uncharacterized RDD family membrane protein YckC
MSSAQLDLQPLDEAAAETEAVIPLGLKQQAAERLAAHRARRTQRSGSSVTHIVQPSPANVRPSRIAAAVAERYAHSQSYRAFLAAEAERAIHEAQAAAEVAAINAQAVADAQYQLLDELDQWSLTPTQPELVAAAPVLLPAASEAPIPAPSSPHPTTAGGLTVRLYEDATLAHAEPGTELIAATRRHQPWEQTDEAEGLALDEEIAFRQSPVFEEPHGPPTEIPANLIEFPRQLVASRKARPRLAEGPLREDATQLSQHPETAQLRIFEVEATQISTTPVVESVEPEWSSILLGALPAPAPVESAEPVYDPFQPLHVAPIGLRLMAGIVDGCILLAALMAFTTVFAITVGKLASGQVAAGVSGQIFTPMTIPSAAISAAVVLGVLALIYHLLFFTLGEATPGMRYARIGLCTFSDENPTRSAMRRRLFAMVLSACPLGIGFLWACLDDDRLGWHDRISRMYQRSY